MNLAPGMNAVESPALDAATLCLDDLPFTVLVIDRDLRITMTNSFARSMVGKSTRLRHLRLLEPGSDVPLTEEQLPVQRVFDTGDRFSLRGIEFVNDKGERVPLLFWAKPFEVSASGEIESVVAMILADYEVDPSGEVRQARLEAAAAVRAKNHFLANVSHELRTPLTGIMGFLQLVIRGENMMPDQIKSLNMALDCTYRLQALMDSVLELASIEAEEVELVPETFDVRELIADIDSAYSPQAVMKELAFEVEISDQYREITADREKIGHVVNALVDNAIKFTVCGSVRLEVVTIVSGTKSHLMVQVIDTGVGIPVEKQDALFEAFHQQLDYQSVAGQATGLGLTLCQRYIQMMGGQLEFDSRPGEGTTFRVELPVEVADAGVAPPTQDSDEFDDEDVTGASNTQLSLQALGRALSAIDDEVRATLIEAVMSADPERFISSLSDIGLSKRNQAYARYLVETYRYDEILALLSQD